MRRVLVVGLGEFSPRARETDLEIREMTFEAAERAFLDADMTPDDVQGVVSSGLDFNEGVSITDSFTPDQMGGRLKFNMLVSGDALEAVYHAFMMVKSGLLDVVVVDGHAKPSEIENYRDVLRGSLDPYCTRPLGLDPYVIAGLEARAFLARSGLPATVLSRIAVKNINRAALIGAPYGERVIVEDIEADDFLYAPLKERHVAKFSDYAGAIIMASEDAVAVSDRCVELVAVENSGLSSTPHFWLRDWGRARWVRSALDRIRSKHKVVTEGVDLVEVTEFFAHQELMIASELGVDAGATADERTTPVFNPSGGCLGNGNSLTASGMRAFIAAVKQLRGEAGPVQRKDAHRGLVVSMHSEISDIGSVALLQGVGE
ncbi:MAG: hypothetical protein NZ988_00775 [Thaumarchaeota archaeon]|nr:hypothetical protein [Candidatus Calditenuaceae archaeon]MDW8186568.1 hypothetical protein [Nitrososphaerota archaeon]